MSDEIEKKGRTQNWRDVLPRILVGRKEWMETVFSCLLGLIPPTTTTINNIKYTDVIQLRKIHHRTLCTQILDFPRRGDFLAYDRDRKRGGTKEHHKMKRVSSWSWQNSTAPRRKREVDSERRVNRIFVAASCQADTPTSSLVLYTTLMSFRGIAQDTASNKGGTLKRRRRSRFSPLWRKVLSTRLWKKKNSQIKRPINSLREIYS